MATGASRTCRQSDSGMGGGPALPAGARRRDAGVLRRLLHGTQVKLVVGAVRKVDRHVPVQCHIETGVETGNP